MSKTAEGCAEDSSAKVLMASHLDASVQTGHWNVTLECSGDLRRTNLRGILAFEMLDKTKDARLRGTLERVFSVVRKNRWQHPYGKITIYDSSKQHGVSTGMVKQISIAWDNISPFGWERCNDLRFIIDCVFEMPAYDPMAYTDQEAWVRSNTETVCRCTMERIVRLGNMEYSDISPHPVLRSKHHTQLCDNSLVFTLSAHPSEGNSCPIYARLDAPLGNNGRHTFGNLILLIRIRKEELEHMEYSNIYRREHIPEIRALTVRCDNKVCVSGVDVDTFMCNESQYVTRDEVEDSGDGSACGCCSTPSSATQGLSSDPMASMRKEWLTRELAAQRASEEQIELYVPDDVDEDAERYLERRRNSLCPVDVDVPCEIINTWGSWNTFFASPDAASRIVSSMNSGHQQGFDRQQTSELAQTVLREYLTEIRNAFTVFK